MAQLGLPLSLSAAAAAAAAAADAAATAAVSAVALVGHLAIVKRVAALEFRGLAPDVVVDVPRDINFSSCCRLLVCRRCCCNIWNGSL